MNITCLSELAKETGIPKYVLQWWYQEKIITPITAIGKMMLFNRTQTLKIIKGRNYKPYKK